MIYVGPAQLIRQNIPYECTLAVYASQSIKRLLKHILQFLSLLQIATSTIYYCPVFVIIVIILRLKNQLIYSEENLAKHKLNFQFMSPLSSNFS